VQDLVQAFQIKRMVQLAVVELVKAGFVRLALALMAIPSLVVAVAVPEFKPVAVELGVPVIMVLQMGLLVMTVILVRPETLVLTVLAAAPTILLTEHGLVAVFQQPVMERHVAVLV
jgi:hypothetical protein